MSNVVRVASGCTAERQRMAFVYGSENDVPADVKRDHPTHALRESLV